MLTLNPYEVSTFAVQGWGALQKVEEFAPLLSLLDEYKPRTILEIGVGNCGSTWAFSKLDSVETIICIDLANGNWGGNPQDTTASRLQQIANYSKAKVHFISGNSQNSECLAEVKKLIGNTSIDFLFIDGDHSYNGVKTDFLTYSPLVSKPGLIGFHDIAEHAPETGCEVEKFWKEIKASGIPESEYSEFILPTEPSWGGVGIIKW
jgi:cephalosporin hydroxylase